MFVVCFLCCFGTAFYTAPVPYLSTTAEWIKSIDLRALILLEDVCWSYVCNLALILLTVLAQTSSTSTMISGDSLCCRCTAIRFFWVKARERGILVELWNRAGIDSATRQIYMKRSPLYSLILHIKWKELKVCGVVIRLLQRIGWLQGKICRGWTLDFGNSKIRNSQCEIGVYIFFL